MKKRIVIKIVFHFGNTAMLFSVHEGAEKCGQEDSYFERRSRAWSANIHEVEPCYW